MSEALFNAFHAELKKLAFSPRASAMLGGGGAGAGAGLLAGAIGGAGLQGYRKYQEAKEQGASGSHAALAGALGGISGVGTGAMVGAGLGAAGGAALGHLRPAMAETVRKGLTQGPGPIGAFSRFGQRQVHGITGWHPGETLGEGMRELRHGAYDAEVALNKLKKPEPGVLDRLRNRTPARASEEAIASAEKRFNAANRAQEMGLTSLPGYARSLKNNGIGNTLGTAVNEQLHGTTNTEKALMLGLPAAQLASTAFSKDDENHPEGSRNVRLAKDTASLAGGLLLGPLPQVTQMMAGAGIHKAIDGSAKLHARFRQPKGTQFRREPIPGTKPSGILISPEQEKAVGPPPEYEVSPAARGQAPEGVA